MMFGATFSKLVGCCALRIGLQWGSNRVPIGQTNLGDVLFVSFFLKVVYGIYGVLIIPEWLINGS